MPSLPLPNAHASSADFEFAALYEARNYRKALLASFQQVLRGNVIEVGAGIGQMSAEIRALQAVERFLAVEPDGRFLPRLHQVLPDESIISGTAHNVAPDERWDAIVSINVLEHIEHDEAELELYRRLLSTHRGHLCLFVPACPEIYAPLDKDFGHFRRYTKPELRNKLRQAGFDIETLKYYNFPGYFAWWLSFCLMKKRGFTQGSVRFYDRIVFPFVCWAERTLCAPPIGQSLLAIAKARS